MDVDQWSFLGEETVFKLQFSNRFQAHSPGVLRGIPDRAQLDHGLAQFGFVEPDAYQLACTQQCCLVQRPAVDHYFHGGVAAPGLPVLAVPHADQIGAIALAQPFGAGLPRRELLDDAGLAEGLWHGAAAG